MNKKIKLKNYRLQKGFTQEDMAKYLGYRSKSGYW
ncbi:MAG: cytochrome b5, partial [Halanaerobiaceae bacterium]|nr:cytochrome b5 [Halanaerobiaceae bacterium]